MDYIDSHVHVWSDDLERYPLASGVKLGDMELHRFLPEQLLNHARPEGVNRIVLIQMSYYGTDNAYMLDVIDQFPDRFRGIAVIDPSAGNLNERMSGLKQRGVRGFRIPIVDSEAENALRLGKLDAMFARAGEQNMAICPLINPQALETLGKVCERFSETPVVVDHLGRIGMAEPISQSQIQVLCNLARQPQISVKVSAFYALGEKRPPHLELRDLIHDVFQAFGPRRLMWGSDCPFQILNEPYHASIDLVRSKLDFLSAEDKEWILSRTAEELFFRD